MVQWVRFCLANLDEKEVWGRMYTCKRVAEFLRCSPEMITTLFINWLYSNTNVNSLKRKKKKKNLPCNAGDEGLFPDWGTKIPHACGAMKPKRYNY